MLTVRLSLRVVDRIAEEALGGLGSLPRRGAEVGGILLGSAPRGEQVVTIVGCLPIACAHHFGPSYVLTPDEKLTLEQALARWRPSPSRNMWAVGYYRSHTRAELFLGDEDVWLMSTYFADPSRVALVVAPRAGGACVGGFFFWEDGRLRADSSHLEFPFDRRALGVAEPEEAAAPDPRSDEAEPQPVITEAVEAGEPVLEAQAGPSEEPTAEPDSATEPAAEAAEPAPLRLPSFLEGAPPKRPRQRLGKVAHLLWLPVCMLLVAVGGWLGTEGAHRLGSGQTRETGVNPYALGLGVTEYGDNLHLTWNRNAPALPYAERGVLIISDGEQNRILELDLRQLRGGSVMYRRLTGPVRFRLELHLKGKRTLTEVWDPPQPRNNPAPR
ncbi:MAG: hypothetical protein FJW34_24080 [Acidobacteria bacterium]|nr:hypothetical protein [Acidobacteriota bacterium]